MKVVGFLEGLFLITTLCLFCGPRFTFSQQVDGRSTTILLNDMSFFQESGDNWQIVGGVIASLEEPNIIKTTDGTGILVNDPKNHQGKDLLTNFKHGDIDLELDFMMARNSNSGIYLQGQYEIQLLDSWTVNVPTSADNGGIYERWDASQPPGKRGYQGYPPRQNASRAPGVWQHLEVSFQAPRFNKNGDKIENAKIIWIKLNGVVIHKSLELQGSTRAPLNEKEVERGPLRFQGDHGAVAFRNINITQYDCPSPSVGNLRYSVFQDPAFSISDKDKVEPVKSGQSELLTSDLGKLPDRFSLYYSGTLRIAMTGNYLFHLDVSGGSGQLRINGATVISPGKKEGNVNLMKGEVMFEVLYAKKSAWMETNLEFAVSSEGLRHHFLSNNLVSDTVVVNPIYVDASEKKMLRSFIYLPDGNRLTHTISVSSTENIHYSYDLDCGNVIQVWRGKFLDATSMWYSRGDGTSEPRGTVEYLLEKPSLTLNKLKNEKSVWGEDSTGTGFTQKGYTLTEKGEPTFQYEIFNIDVHDEIRTVEEGKGFRRTLMLHGRVDQLYVRIATGTSIKKISHDTFLVGDQSYYVQIEKSAKPILRSIDNHQELIIPAKSMMHYSILF